MQIESITLTDIGTFGGRQVFDLAPRTRYGSKRPIVLFGGLNGAGKTTFLTSVRLALYGRHSIEAGSTQKQYEEFLRELIHRPIASLVRSTSASISLEFAYSRLGHRTRYRVLRTWEERSSGVDEKLRVFQGEEQNEILTGEQAQAFLNQLIPSGISQFFFFDGEKIAALARDDSDAVLADAIRRLLGLDLADRLSTDLATYSRQRQSAEQDKRTQGQIVELEDQLSSLEEECATALRHLEGELLPALDNAKAEYERRRTALMDRGGAWAVNRDEIEQRLEGLREERNTIENSIREHLSGIAVFGLAPKLTKRVIDALEQAQQHEERKVFSRAIKQQAEALKQRLFALEEAKSAKRAIKACIDDWAADLTVEKKGYKSKFSFSGAEIRSAISAFTATVPSANRELEVACGMAKKIATIEEELQEKLAHAPSDETLKEAFDALSQAAEDVANREAERRSVIEDVRRKTWASIEITRQLKKLESALHREGVDVKGEQLAESLQNLIADFKAESAAEKCKTLRRYFVEAFTRLARKTDIIHDAVIDPSNFKITLLDRAGREVPKKRLSAGEKQIYAIAMLEALARTSGRNLPIIIDTPLGRLDSKHRRNLVESYFPVASHQVVILSTDTEVDLSFYQGLQPYISHAYHLSFDQLEGATQVEEGYFWKNFGEELSIHAA